MSSPKQTSPEEINIVMTEEFPEPLNLADFSITLPEMPSEIEQLTSSQSFFRQHICSQFGFKSETELDRALRLIQRVEADF
jgi:hypothetical protein